MQLYSKKRRANYQHDNKQKDYKQAYYKNLSQLRALPQPRCTDIQPTASYPKNFSTSRFPAGCHL